MPIVAIEGPDKCGKSTLFQALKQLEWPVPPQFIETPSYGKERMHVAAELSLRELEMWETFYRPDTLYVCNRHVLVTERVYSWLYNRKVLRSSWLQEEVLVAYLDVPVEELQRRHSLCREEIQDPSKYETVRHIYHRVLERFAHVLVPPNVSPVQVQSLVLEAIRGR